MHGFATRELAMPQSVWILVANGSRARVFQRTPPDHTLVEIKDWVHPATRQHHPDLESKHRHSGIRGRSGLAERSPVQDRERSAFAHEICDWLGHALHNDGGARVALLSSNPFLGELVAHGQGALHKHLCATHAVDLTGLSMPQLAQRLHQDYGL
jgi:protein required for attachment to host cells